MAVFGIIELVIIALVVGLVALLIKPETRSVGLALLVGVPLVLVLGALGLFAARAVGFHFMRFAAVPTWAGLGIPLIVLLVLGGIVAMVTLLANKRTRAVGFALLAVPLVLGIVAVPLLLWDVRVAEHERADVPYTGPHGAQALLLSKNVVHSAPPAEPRTPETDQGSSPADSLKSASDNTLSRVIRALGKAVEEELPDGVDAAEVISTAGETIEEDLSQGPEQSKLIHALGKALGEAIAKRTKQRLAPRILALAPAASQEQPPAVDERRPAWVDAPARLVDGVYQMTTMAGPYTTRLECDRALPPRLIDAADEYTELRFGPEAAGRVHLAADYLLDRVVKDQWEETYQASVGPMVRLHVLLHFDHDVEDLLKEKWRRAQISDRLWLIGLGLAVVLGLVGTGYGYLRTDLATGGMYRWRLRLAALAAVLLIVGAVVMFLLAAAQSQPPGTSVVLLDSPVIEAVDYSATPPQAVVSAETHVRPVLAKWVVLSGGAVVLLVLLVAVALLLASKRTRPIGVALLVLLVIGGLLLIA